MSDPSTLSSPAPEAPRAIADAAPWPALWLVMIALAFVAAVGTQAAIGRAIPMLLPTALALVILVVACVFDSATERIPNPLTYTAILVGLALSSVHFAAERIGHDRLAELLLAPGPRQAILGFALAAGIGLVCLVLAGLGGGDLKLLAALGALLGPEGALGVFAWGMAVGVVYAVVNLAIAGRLNVFFRWLSLEMLGVLMARGPLPTAPAASRTIPLAVPLLVGLPLARWIPLDELARWLGGAW